MNPFAQNVKVVTCSPKRSAIGLKIVILGDVPSKSNCYRIITFKSKDPNKPSHASLAKMKDLVEYEKGFLLQCPRFDFTIEHSFKFQMDVYYPNRRKDLDNSLKIVLDCLQKRGVIKNDNLCSDIRVKKFIDAANPRVEFVITIE